MKNFSPCRTETDSPDSVEVPANALIGSNTLRALKSFPLTDKTPGQEHKFPNALAFINDSNN